MPLLDGTEYRPLGKRTSDGGPIFWVADEIKARDNNFIYQMLYAEIGRLSDAFRHAILSSGQNLPLKVQWISMPGGGCEIHIDAKQTADRAAAEKAEYRLLDERTRAGGPIFWVADEVKARDGTFVNKMLKAELKNLPDYWAIAMASSPEFTVQCAPSPTGGYKVHVDHCNPDVTVSEDGKATIRGATLARVKELAKKVDDEEKAKESKTGCFIATAALGSSSATQLMVLQQFRDRHLHRFRLGRWFVAAYYRVSPPIAAFISRHPRLRVLVRDWLVLPSATVVSKLKLGDSDKQ